jgi:hypothetical protein
MTNYRFKKGDRVALAPSVTKLPYVNIRHEKLTVAFPWMKGTVIGYSDT